MEEHDFWVSLEFRLSREFAGLPNGYDRHFWCDGFAPIEYLLDNIQPRIAGKVWICNGHRQDEWDFVLFLPRPFGSREEIDWMALLPPDGTTRWMAFDLGRRYLEIEPAAAVQDLH